MVNKDTLHTIEFKIEAVSTQLDEDQYINTVADIISKHLGYALVGVFLFDVTILRLV